MNKDRIDVMEKFGVCSVVMSYYSWIHKSFLVLAQLNRGSREMLDINYDGFLNSMNGNILWLEIDEYNKEAFLLPCSLFKLSFELNNSDVLKSFFVWIRNIKDKEGYYFNQHFMHNRLSINRIWVDAKLTETLFRDIDLIKATEVVNYTRNNIEDSYNLQDIVKIK